MYYFDNIWKMSNRNQKAMNRNRRYKIGIICGVLLFLVVAPVTFLISVVKAFIRVHERGLDSNAEWLSAAFEAVGWAKSFSIIIAILGLSIFVISICLLKVNMKAAAARKNQD